MFIQQLSTHLFWDVDPIKLDSSKNLDLIVERVLMYGKLKDWKLLVHHIGIKRIVQTAKQLRYLDDVSLHFIASITNTALSEFRCYTERQSLKGHWSS